MAKSIQLPDPQSAPCHFGDSENRIHRREW